MREVRVRRLRLDEIQRDPMFDAALNIWNETVAGSRIDVGISGLAATCDPATNLFHSDMNANSVLDYRVKTLRQSFDLRQTRGEEIGNYPDASYIDRVLAPNYTTAAAENVPIFRRIMTPMLGMIAVYEGILLPYFDNSGRNALSLSRLLYLAEEAELAEPVTLSDRELLCLDHLAMGLPPKQIAFVLGVSTRTVEHIIERIKSKLQARNAAHAVAKGIFSLGLPSPSVRLNHKRNSLRTLSIRERQCLGLLTSGNSALSIAEALGLSVKTIDKHLKSARNKLSARNAVDLVARGAGAAVGSVADE